MNPKQLSFQNTAQTIIKNLNKRNTQGYYCATKEETLQKALQLMPAKSSIGWGGSMSLEEIGLLDAIKQGDYNAIDRTQGDPKEQASKIFLADYFLMSTNAITLDGELINIDGRANRICYLCYGPEHVLIIAGMNKVVPDIENGIKRVRNMATPPNTTRLHKDTPCAKVGRCMDCLAPDCICNQVLVTRRSGQAGRISVILVGEELGY